MYLVCGEALFDFFLTHEDDPSALQFHAVAGGSPFNVALGIVRQGARSALFTGVSRDMLGERLVAVLDNAGVETRYLVRSHRPSTLSLVDLSQDCQPSYAFYGDGAADRSLTSDDLPILGDEISGIHFGSYSIAAEPTASSFARLAEREGHRFISLDPNVRAAVIPSADLWRKRIDCLLPHVNLVKTSTEDLAILYPDAPIETVARGWLRAGPQWVVVTDGPDTVRAFRETDVLTVEPPSVHVVDTVGAGDAFQATMLARLGDYALSGDLLPGLSSAELRTILQSAAEAAAESCTRRGFNCPPQD